MISVPSVVRHRAAVIVFSTASRGMHVALKAHGQRFRTPRGSCYEAMGKDQRPCASGEIWCVLEADLSRPVPGHTEAPRPQE